MTLITEETQEVLKHSIHNALDLDFLVSIMDEDEITETPEHLEISAPILYYNGDVDVLKDSIVGLAENLGLNYLNHEVHEFLVITVC